MKQAVFTAAAFMIWLVLSTAGAAEKKIKFEEKKMKLGKANLTVEVADSEEKRMLGLMNRTSLAEGRGMLFVFYNEKPLSFWMKNTFIPLSIGFFDKNKKLVDMQDMDPVLSVMDQNIPQYKSRVPAQYALEVPRGWFAKQKIKLKEQFNLSP